MSNPNHKPVEVVAGEGLGIFHYDSQSSVQYQLFIDEIQLKNMVERQIVNGAVEKIELEQRVAKLEARLEALEMKEKR